MLDKGLRVENQRLFGTVSIKMKFKIETIMMRLGHFCNFRVKEFVLKKPFKDDLITEEDDKLEVISEILKMSYIHTLTIPIYDQNPLSTLFNLFLEKPNVVENIKLKLHCKLSKFQKKEIKWFKTRIWI
mmetsp:Transcript_5783/g.4966  ORF Transcript_5783/g.4966 Transcript_5783/m.4966 type:complete len:129 (+) Transcript_5783:594-980(+)